MHEVALTPQLTAAVAKRITTGDQLRPAGQAFCFGISFLSASAA
jgi:hypothetical protein